MADGELGAPQPLAYLEVPEGEQRISFGFLTGADTAKFKGIMDCHALTGELILYGSVVISDKVFPRVPQTRPEQETGD